MQQENYQDAEDAPANNTGLGVRRHAFFYIFTLRSGARRQASKRYAQWPDCFAKKYFQFIYGWTFISVGEIKSN